jgi:hypothetical protein
MRSLMLTVSPSALQEFKQFCLLAEMDRKTFLAAFEQLRPALQSWDTSKPPSAQLEFAQAIERFEALAHKHAADCALYHHGRVQRAHRATLAVLATFSDLIASLIVSQHLPLCLITLPCAG